MARNVWLRSANTSNVRNAYNVNTSGASNNNNCSSGYAFVPDIGRILVFEKGPFQCPGLE